MALKLNLRQIALQIAEKLRAIATRQGRVPFKTGWLRKGHRVEPAGVAGARMTADTPYARAVHDGRPEIIIRPKIGRVGKTTTFKRTSKRGKVHSVTRTHPPMLSWPGAAHPVRQVRQPARKGKPWIAQSIQDLSDEGLGWLKPQLGEDVVRELERSLRSQHLVVRRG